MMNELQESEFLCSVENHKMTVIRDDGLYRHIRFKHQETMCMHFDLITWPGYLCYTGDMGTYVFHRMPDMFEFFRADRDSAWLKREGSTLSINPSYWSQWVEAKDIYAGIRQFSESKFEYEIKRSIIDWIRENRANTTKRDRRELWEAVRIQVLGADDYGNGAQRICAMHDYVHFINNKVKNFHFEELSGADFRIFSHGFVWCCCALAWGIEQYDTYKTKE